MVRVSSIVVYLLGTFLSFGFLFSFFSFVAKRFPNPPKRCGVLCGCLTWASVGSLKLSSRGLKYEWEK